MAIACVGCGPSTASLTGTVTIAGNPIPADAEARIGFTPEGAASSETVSAAIESGTYEVTGVPVGPSLVTFHIVKPIGKPYKSKRTGQTIQDTKILVPPRSLGGVEYEVAASGGEKNFDL